jgi:hypothetical protein
LKKLRKALKAIEAIKEKVQAGQDINDDQRVKLATEKATRTEIEMLQEGDPAVAAAETQQA